MRVGRRPGAVAAVACVLAAAACGSASDEPKATPPAPTTAPSEARIELSGVVRTSPEDRLVTLEAAAGSGQPARTWVLVGPVRSLADGERVKVVGRPDRDADTTAQRGPIFRVESVERS
ncbi:hypothetical protein GCM10009821_16280 [Aeromicrobium halocynthiae]|uniref:DUF5666 domain-containing protein n=1 Tax=Aeromicrobium halocynthiae TaxID=560557 RepID=A0ABN2VYK9_9ACTN